MNPNAHSSTTLSCPMLCLYTLPQGFAAILSKFTRQVVSLWRFVIELENFVMGRDGSTTCGYAVWNVESFSLKYSANLAMHFSSPATIYFLFCIIIDRIHSFVSFSCFFPCSLCQFHGSLFPPTSVSHFERVSLQFSVC